MTWTWSLFVEGLIIECLLHPEPATESLRSPGLGRNFLNLFFLSLFKFLWEFWFWWKGSRGVRGEGIKYRGISCFLLRREELHTLGFFGCKQQRGLWTISGEGKHKTAHDVTWWRVAESHTVAYFPQRGSPELVHQCFGVLWAAILGMWLLSLNLGPRSDQDQELMEQSLHAALGVT